MNWASFLAIFDIWRSLVGQDADFVPDKMNSVRVLADIPESERPNIQVLKTSSPAFKNHMASFKKADGSYPDICDISVPTRVKP